MNFEILHPLPSGLLRQDEHNHLGNKQGFEEGGGARKRKETAGAVIGFKIKGNLIYAFKKSKKLFFAIRRSMSLTAILLMGDPAMHSD